MMKGKRFIRNVVILCLSAVLVTACISRTTDADATGDSGSEETTAELPKLVNPISEYSSLKEINEIVGCKLCGPGVMGVNNQSYCVINTDVRIAQYSYAVNAMKCTMRAAKTLADISGVYYSGKTLGVLLDAQAGEGKEGVLETKSGKYARWFDGEMQYSFYMEKADAMDMETFSGIVEELKLATGVISEPAAKVPELVAQKHELALEKEGMSAPAVKFRYDTYTIENEGFDLLKKSIEEYFGEVERSMTAQYEEAVRDWESMTVQPEGRFGGWESSREFTVTRLDAKILSGYESYYTYFGGPHPNSMIVGVNFDVATGTRLALADVVEDYDAVCEQVLAYLANDFEYKDELFPDYEDMVREYFYPSGQSDYTYDLSWYFQEEKIIICFNQYDIAPYALGRVLVELPAKGEYVQ